jgi:uncharacterized protein YndB with AHSA1/START domain
MADTSFTYPAGEPIMVTTRVFDAPRELVWAACTEAEHMARWWGPRRYIAEVREMDARPGGRWAVDHHSPDGKVFRFSGVFREVVRPERLVLTFTFEGNPGDEVVETHTFEPVGEGTRLTTVSRFASVADRDGMKASGMEGGARESYERLDELLAELQAGGTACVTEREMIVSRVYDAPRELVFDTWTDPEHLGEWWGPNGFRTTVHSMDVRPGGVSRYMMHGPDGTDYPNHVRYEQVVRPERLVYSHGSDDEPDMFHVTVTFDDAGGGTRLTLRSLFPTPEALAARMKFGALEGGRQTLARLADYLAGAGVAR